MFHRFFTKIEQGQNSSKLPMPIFFLLALFYFYFFFQNADFNPNLQEFLVLLELGLRLPSARNQGQHLGSGLWVEVRVNPKGQVYCLGFRASVQGQGYCLGLALALIVRVSTSDQVRVKVRTRQGQRSVRPRETISTF